MLTLAQEYALDDCLRQQNLLTNEDLIVELTDHFALSVDEQMASGTAFETALANVVTDFGGRKELQKMERRYNGVTFKRYTHFLAQTALNQFKPPRLWFTLAIYGFFFYANTDSPLTGKHAHFLGSLGVGLLAGLVLMSIVSAGDQYGNYFRALVRHGFHNPPTEIQYVLTRILGGALLLIGIGEAGWLLAQIWPVLLHPAIAAAYITGVCVCVQAYSQLHNQLYNVNPTSN